MKKIGLLIGVLVICVLLGNYKYKEIIRHPIKTDKDVHVTVKNGDTLYSVLDNLNQNGAIKNSSILKFYIKTNKIKSNVHPGRYSVPKDVTITQLITIISTIGNDEDIIKVTIPEGYDINSIANVLEEKGIISKDKFIDSCKAYKLPTYIMEKEDRKYNLEGFLFPATYDFKADMDGNEIIKSMLNKFESTIKELNIEKPIDMEKLDNLIIMASIVENEVTDKSELDIVASVFYNRLKIDMQLQSCATVLYSLGIHKDVLLDKDLKVQSPYNTYLVDGFPIGPISNPGKESIKAALSPATTNYLYFVSTNDGKHFFTDDYKKFLEIKEKTQGF
jgi:UPF0755 protein